MEMEIYDTKERGQRGAFLFSLISFDSYTSVDAEIVVDTDSSSTVLFGRQEPDGSRDCVSQFHVDEVRMGSESFHQYFLFG